MLSKYYPPKFNSENYHCPYCHVFADQQWWGVYFYRNKFEHIDILRVSICSHCKKEAYWYDGNLVIPNASTAPNPHDDLPASIVPDYIEARSIVNASPRGAAALLRLCLQKLMVEFGESGKDINKDIGSLVQKGLPEEVQQALDVVRVIGNEAVHPGELNLMDDQEIALQLFELINFIVEDRISRKKKISSLFSRLPESKRNGIEQRDKS